MNFFTNQLIELNRNGVIRQIPRRIYLSAACARYGEAEGNSPIALDPAAIMLGSICRAYRPAAESRKIRTTIAASAGSMRHLPPSLASLAPGHNVVAIGRAARSPTGEGSPELSTLGFVTQVSEHHLGHRPHDADGHLGHCTDAGRMTFDTA